VLLIGSTFHGRLTGSYFAGIELIQKPQNYIGKSVEEEICEWILQRKADSAEKSKCRTEKMTEVHKGRDVHIHTLLLPC
jgi:hypothetical protein